MFRLLRLLIFLLLLGGAVVFAATVPLGEKTLWEHIKAIAGSRESQELVEGVKKKADTVFRAPDGGGDQLSAEEREQLRRLIRERLAAEPDGGAPGKLR